MSLRVLVVGGGGREHALAWGLARSGSVSEVHALPGNPGIATVAHCVAGDADDASVVAAVADDLAADLVVVGPETPLVAGVADAVAARGHAVFGPSAAAARLEGSKAWMKALLAEVGVPTARHAVFGSGEDAAARSFLDTLDGLYVVKTDGLAAGKGVVVTESLSEARDAVRRYLNGEAFGDAGRTLVIEEGLEGPELSLLVVCNGDPDAAVPLAPAQDFKRIGERDSGPNTGGMGAFSPVPVVSSELIEQVMANAVRPTLHALAARGAPYRGVLYAGLMLTPDGPKILEYNVRFGDPECQVVIPRFETDLGALCWHAATGSPMPTVGFRPEACVGVVVASEGYPASPRTGDVIAGLQDAAALPDVTVFHAGTRRGDHGSLVTAGGRVFDVTALGRTIAEARRRAYEAVEKITWPGAQYRRDIAASVA